MRGTVKCEIYKKVKKRIKFGDYIGRYARKKENCPALLQSTLQINPFLN